VGTTEIVWGLIALAIVAKISYDIGFEHGTLGDDSGARDTGHWRSVAKRMEKEKREREKREAEIES